ncbi:MAG TPA: ABC transporter ATP-binding protein [Clostridia bacterium]|nr:ABC transporter ATP-binding protein [Clostridia bacterium]
MFKGLVFFLKHGWKYDKRYIVWRVLHQLIRSALPVVAALAPKLIIDELIGAQNVAHLAAYVALLAGYTLAVGALSSFFGWDGFTRRCRVDAAFGLDLHRRLALADYANLESPDFLDMQEKAKKFLYSDYHGFGYLLDCALDVLGAVLTLAGVASLIALMSWKLLLLFALLAGLGAWIEGRARAKAMALSFEVVGDRRRWIYYARLFEDCAYGKEIRLNGLADWMLAREKASLLQINDNIARQNARFMGAGVAGAAFTFLEQAAAYTYLIARVLEGGMGVGDFVLYAAAVTAFGAALRNMLSSVVDIRSYDLYYDKLDDYLNLPRVMRQGKLPLPAGAHEIRFENVGFRYPGAEGWALRNVDITLGPGERLCLVGENGAGKSTFVKLLCRLYDPSEGRILLDATDIREFDYDAYMKLFSCVFQDFRLFSMSIRDNVVLAGDADDEDVLGALVRAGLGERVAGEKDGIFTSIGREFDPEGFEPSGGEAQKLAITRALIRDAPVVILDEPTAALDPKAEYEMFRHFRELVAGKTAVFVSHRLGAAKLCDRVAVFAGGGIAETGAHEELMAQGGAYASMFALQASLYN